MFKFAAGAKLGAFATTGLVLVYVAILGQHGLLLVSSGDPLQIVFGALILVFPVIAIFSIYREFKFGIAVEKLAKSLETKNEWPMFSFELRPSGRPTKESARLEFERVRKLTEADPDNWKSWFALGLTYDAAGDRPRARAAMREAIRRSSGE
ncbi:MAG: hypothetical protein RLZZ359_367 [Actinomycetota bacterium]|jgi:tetratricopeptide (TPR) repeat protein